MGRPLVPYVPEPLDGIGESVAFFGKLIDLAGVAPEVRRDVIERLGDGSELLDCIHVCTNADAVSGMHPPGRGNPGGSLYF